MRDIEILKQIKQFFNVGTISYNLDKTSVIFRVRSLNDLSIIIKFFQKFPLLTSKRHNFNLFVILYEIICRKQHLTITGFMKAIAIINNINNTIKPDLLAQIIHSFGPLPLLILPAVTSPLRSATLPPPNNFFLFLILDE